jgi:hypothetical protein
MIYLSDCLYLEKHKIMKKTLLSLAIIGCALLSSCDDNNPTDAVPYVPVAVQNKFVKASINGVPHTFDQTTVEKQDLTSPEGVPYTDLIVTANKRNDNSSQIKFRLEYMRTGAETCYYFLYQIGAVEYDIEEDNSFHVNVSHGEANKIKGNFSGTLHDFEGNAITISNGNFDIAF